MRVTLVSTVGVEVDAPDGRIADALVGAGYAPKPEKKDRLATPAKKPQARGRRSGSSGTATSPSGKSSARSHRAGGAKDK